MLHGTAVERKMRKYVCVGRSQNFLILNLPVRVITTRRETVSVGPHVYVDSLEGN
jgi:hypothetical protein